MPMVPIEQNTLRTQLLFPWYDGKGKTPSNARLKKIMQSVNLSQVLQRLGEKGLQKTDIWGTALSMGEQQRLAFGRVLLAQPKMVFLDEATSALDEENEVRMYSLMRELGISYISVGHHPKLAHFHKQVLFMEGNQKWKLMTPKEYLKMVESDLENMDQKSL
jgi:putative ATP-binding cassette transporter